MRRSPLEPASRVLIASSNDRGDVHRLHDQSIDVTACTAVDAEQDYRIEDDEARVTFWLLISTDREHVAGDLSAQSLATWIEEADRVYASRVTGPHAVRALA